MMKNSISLSSKRTSFCPFSFNILQYNSVTIFQTSRATHNISRNGRTVFMTNYIQELRGKNSQDKHILLFSNFQTKPC